MAVAPSSGSLSDRVGTRALACSGAATCALSLFFMSQLRASASSSDVVWRVILSGLGTGIFQSPNNSAVMGSAPKPHLGIASGILATMRNVGMVLGIATAGAVLYALAPSYILQKASLGFSESALFLSGLKYAYLAGAILTGLASVTSLMRRKEKKQSTDKNLVRT
jgi:MFS family permease